MLYNPAEVPAVINNVRTLREKRGLTQEQLALLVQVSRQTVNAIETGRYKPSLLVALKIAAVFGIPVEEVFALEAEDW